MHMGTRFYVLCLMLYVQYLCKKCIGQLYSAVLLPVSEELKEVIVKYEQELSL